MKNNLHNFSFRLLLLLLLTFTFSLPLKAEPPQGMTFVGCYKGNGTLSNPRAYMDLWRVKPWDFDHRLQMCVNFCTNGTTPSGAVSIYNKEGGFPHRYAGYGLGNWCYCGGELKGSPFSNLENCGQLSVYRRGISVQPPPTSTSLGSIWREKESGWNGMWTRRGNSNVFDAVWTMGAGRVTAVLTMQIQGNTVSISRNQSSDGNNCKYTGSLAADKRSVSGTYTCSRYPGPFSWSAQISSGGVAQPLARTFTQPTLGQYRLDWCRDYAANCGNLAAQAFCKRAGYSTAKSFRGPDMAPNITQIIGTGQLCQGAGCGGFYSITCQ